MESKELRRESHSFGALEDNVRGDAGPAARSISDSIASGRDAVGSLATKVIDSGQSELDNLRSELERLKSEISGYMSDAAQHAGESVRNAKAGVVERASDLVAKGSELGAAASEQGKSFAADVEQMVRRNPIGAIVGAATIGVLVGLLGRRS